MPRWRIFPVAAPGVGRWQGRHIWPETVVEAGSAAQARLAAAAEVLDRHQPRVGNESRAMVTGFEDEKLYWVQELASEAMRSGDRR
jgi:hypothetical protein